MGNKVYGAVVLVLWMASMSWLMATKIFPTYFHGDAPSRGVANQNAPVGWSIEVAGEHCGYTVSQRVSGADNVSELHTRVMLDRLSLDKVAPAWVMALVNDLGNIRVDMRNKTIYDSLGNLTLLESRVTVNNLPSVLKMSGKVQDGKLRLRMRSGELTRTVEYPWKQGDLLGELSPESRLLQAYVGRSWRSEVYSPFGSPHDPIELIEARVVEEEEILFNSELTRTRRIEYRSVSSAGVSSSQRIRASLWVAEDGQVLKQNVKFLNTSLSFTRVPDEMAAQLADDHLELDKYSWEPGPNRSPRDLSPKAFE